MAFSHVDFAIAVGVFLVFLGFLFGYLVSYLVNYRNLAETAELREIASNLFNTFFIGKGVPSNWENQDVPPVKVGLMDNLYLIVINVTEADGSSRNNIVINGSVEFDEKCERNVLNKTLILYDSNNEKIPFQLYNQTFCGSNFLKKGDLVFNLNLEPYQSKFFFLYFSSEESVLAESYSIEFPSNEYNYTFNTFPVQEIQMISVDKIKALRNLNYGSLLQTIPKDYSFRVEVE
ncbi:MAG: hypothetical protein QXL86_02835 [Candidatus Aenigmatarchaeota archaeon]